MNEALIHTEERTLLIALEALEMHLGIGWKTRYTTNEQEFLGETEIYITQGMIDGHVERYRAIAFVQKDFREKTLIRLLDKLRRMDIHQKVIVIADKIYPKVKTFLKNRNIDYLDTAGNCRMQNAQGFFLDIEGKKIQDHYKDIPNRAFNKAGLKVIFQFLQEKQLINATYRDIKEKVDVALGAIKFVLNGLLEEGFLIRKSEGYELTNETELIERWTKAYGERLKPTLLLGKYRFLNPNDFVHWKELPLKPGTYWGGEAAGALYTNNLKPAELTIYTQETKKELMTNYKLIPDPEGNVQVYQKFWKKNEPGNKVPPLLAYADLILTRDPRCLEITLEIDEQYIHKNI